uniref:SRCR domain-containing protein n=1 Tax=Globodera pallida TaxID=36090 RepID=A0A183CL07_GLOPA
MIHIHNFDIFQHERSCRCTHSSVVHLRPAALIIVLLEWKQREAKRGPSVNKTCPEDDDDPTMQWHIVHIEWGCSLDTNQLYYTYCESWEGSQICGELRVHLWKKTCDFSNVNLTKTTTTTPTTTRHDYNHWEDEHDHGRFNVEHGTIG